MIDRLSNAAKVAAIIIQTVLVLGSLGALTMFALHSLQVMQSP